MIQKTVEMVDLETKHLVIKGGIFAIFGKGVLEIGFSITGKGASIKREIRAIGKVEAVAIKDKRIT